MKLLKLNLKWLFKLMGPVIFIVIIIRIVDPVAAADVIKRIDVGVALASILFTPIIIAALTFRWWHIGLRLAMKLTASGLFQINYISWFLSFLPVVGISPLTKFIYLKEEGQPTGKAAISITVDKLFEIIGQLFFGIFALIYFPDILFSGMHYWVYLAAGCAALFVVLMFWKRIWPVATELMKRYTSNRIKKIGKNLEIELSEFWKRFDLSFLAIILIISVALGLLRALVLYLLAISLDISVDFGLIIACRALIGVVNVIPISINGLGTRDAILLFALPLAGISRESAIALAFVAFLWTISSKLSGVIFWLGRPLPAKNIVSKKKSLLP